MLLNISFFVIILNVIGGDYLEDNPNILYLGDKCGNQMTEIIDGTTYTYCCIECLKVYEADEILPGSCCDDNSADNIIIQDRRRLNPAIESRSSYWANGYVPYVIESTLPNQDRIVKAINHWNENTNIKLGRRTNENDYIEFKEHESACNSCVGMCGGGQTINIADWCKFGSIVHEIGHAIGFHHTQSREDRDEYVIVHEENIPDDKIPIFDQATKYANDCLRYDYKSIMHYSKTAFSDPSGSITLETINPRGSVIGQRDGLSVVDIGCANSIYSPCRVALFSDWNFGGEEYSPFGSDDYTLDELISLEFIDNTVSSVKISADSNTYCSVHLFQHSDKSGWSVTLNADNTQNDDMQIFSYTKSELEAQGFGNDGMSALKVTDTSSCSAYFYETDSGFEYDALIGSYPIGDYVLNHLLVKGFVDNKASSMIIIALKNEKCVIELFGNGDYSGWESTVIADNIDGDIFKIFSFDLSELQNEYDFVNNALSSFKLYSISEIIEDSESEIQSHGGKCLDIDVAELYKNGGTVQTWSCNNAIQQLWYYDRLSGTIINKAGKCLDVDYSDYYNNVNGALVQIWDCLDGYNNQKWSIAGNQIISKNGKCLDIHNQHYNDDINGGKIQLWDCNGWQNQMWTF